MNLGFGVVCLLLAGTGSALAGTAEPVREGTQPFAGRSAVAEGPDCFEELMNGHAPEIACAFPTKMSDTEKAEVARISHDLLTDASCTVTIKIDRALVDTALKTTGDYVFEAPPQKTHCDVKSSLGELPIDLTFAPRVEFKAGVAVKASPGMDNVSGVTRVLWWPIAYWVNSSATIEEPTLRVVNAVKQRLATKAP